MKVRLTLRLLVDAVVFGSALRVIVGEGRHTFMSVQPELRSGRPKAWNNPAQGNALGSRARNGPRCKGGTFLCRLRPRRPGPWGVAPGWSAMLLRSVNFGVRIQSEHRSNSPCLLPLAPAIPVEQHAGSETGAPRSRSSRLRFSMPQLPAGLCPRRSGRARPCARPGRWSPVRESRSARSRRSRC